MSDDRMGVTTVSTLPGRLCERTGDDAAKTTTTMANSKSDADEEESSRAAALRLDGGGGIGATKAVTKERNAATARSTNLTPGKPRRCSNCGKRFDSGNKLHAHLKDCSAPPRQVNKSDTVVGHGKRKHEPTQPPASAPETYEDAINAPKRRRFMHHGLAGDVEAVELDGTFFYNTTPRTHASPHRTWHRPRTPNAAHQASAATGSGHQASATNGSGHHEAPATTGPGHLASATISASTTAPASAASAQAPATSKPPATA